MATKKAVHALVISAVILGWTGCVTSSVIEKARPLESWQSRKDPKDRGAHPGYYALLPLAVPIDIATSPFQFAAVMFVAGTMGGWW